MRWHVHGTDITTGQNVTLAIDETDATHAVQTALSKRIIVSHVTREWLRRLLFPMSCAAVVVLTPVCGALYYYERATRIDLQKSLAEQSRLSAALIESEKTVADTRAAQSTLLDYRTLTAANARAAAAEKQVADIRQQLANADTVSAELAATSTALTNTRARMQLLEEQLKNKSAPAPASTPSPELEERAATLEKENKTLSSQVDLLKSQLLLAAAQSTPHEEPQPKTEEPATPTETRWALRTGYDPAADFLAVHFDKDTLQLAPAPDGTIIQTAANAANAVTIRLVHDKQRRRLYAATLTLSFASDAPKDKLIENLTLLKTFLHAVAPSAASLDDRLPALLAQLATKPSAERFILLTDDAKITLWHHQSGEYSCRLESPGAELAE